MRAAFSKQKHKVKQPSYTRRKNIHPTTFLSFFSLHVHSIQRNLFARLLVRAVLNNVAYLGAFSLRQVREGDLERYTHVALGAALFEKVKK